MKVLFVCSGNNKNFNISPFIAEQGKSLQNIGVSVEYYPVKGKGILGYLQAGFSLRKHMKKNKYDLLHAHFIFSGWTAIIGSRGLPIVLSLMGSDAYGEYVGVNKVSFKSRFNTLLTLMAQPFVKAIISKSSNIERFVYLKYKSFIIPNGIDKKKFTPMDILRNDASRLLREKQVLFLGSSTNVRKNFSLVKSAVSLLGPDVKLIHPYPISHSQIPELLNSVDVLAVPSLMEGSPNVVKEAMACNCPIVATDTGDVKWVLGNTEGCYVTSFDVKDFSKKLSNALHFASTKGRTNGSERIDSLQLGAEEVARKVLAVYKKVCH